MSTDSCVLEEGESRRYNIGIRMGVKRKEKKTREREMRVSSHDCTRFSFSLLWKKIGRRHTYLKCDLLEREEKSEIDKRETDLGKKKKKTNPICVIR